MHTLTLTTRQIELLLDVLEALDQDDDDAAEVLTLIRNIQAQTGVE